MRSSTGGNSPAATRAASIGALLNSPPIAAPAPAAAPRSDSPVATAATGASSSTPAASHRNVVPIYASARLRSEHRFRTRPKPVNPGSRRTL